MAVVIDKKASELTAPVSIADTDVFAGYRPGTGGEPNLDIRATAGLLRSTTADVSTGRVARTIDDLSKDFANARSYGIYDDGSDCLANLQGLIDQVAEDGGGIIDLPRRDGGFYALSSPLALMSNVYLRGWGAGCWIKNTRTSFVTTSREYFVFLMGTYHPTYLDELTYYNGSTISTPTRTFSCSTVAQAGNFVAGDMVIVRSREYYLGAGSHQRPDYMLLANVVSANAGTGAVVLDRLIDETITNPQIAKVNDTGIVPSSTPHDTLYMPKNCGLLNLSIESVTGEPCGLGGNLDCTLDIHDWRGNVGVYLNSMSFLKAHVRRMRVREKALDIAMGSHCSGITIDDLQYDGHPTKAPGSDGSYGGGADLPSLILSNENSRSNHIHIRRLNAGPRAAGDMIKFLACRHETFRVDDLYAPNEIGSLIVLNNEAQPVSGDQVQPKTHDHELSFGKVTTGGGLARYIYEINAGGELKRHKLMAGDFYGAVGTSAVTFAGDGAYVDPSCSFEYGNLSLGAGTTNVRALGVKAAGITDNSGLTANLVSVTSTSLTRTVHIPVTDFRQSAAMKDMLPDAAAGTAGSAPGVTGAFGLADAAASIVSGNVTNNNAVLNTLGFYFQLPFWYKAGGSITFRIKVRVSVVRTVSATLDLEAFLSSGSQTLSSDICATAAQSCNSATLAFYSFAVTPTGALPGDRLYCIVTGAANDTGGASNGTFQVQWVEAVLASVL